MRPVRSCLLSRQIVIGVVADVELARSKGFLDDVVAVLVSAAAIHRRMSSWVDIPVALMCDALKECYKKDEISAALMGGSVLVRTTAGESLRQGMGAEWRVRGGGTRKGGVELHGAWPRRFVAPQGVAIELRQEATARR